MTNGTSLPKKIKNFDKELKDIRKKSLLTSKSIANITAALKSAEKHKRNLNGYNAEKSARYILKNLPGFSSKSQHPIICTEVESIITMSKTIIIDEFITSHYCNKTLFAEVKYQESPGSVYEKNFKDVYNFVHIKKQQLLIVSGSFYDVDCISKFNRSFLETNSIKYIYMIHENDLEEFLNIWKYQSETDFKEIHFLLNKYL